MSLKEPIQLLDLVVIPIEYKILRDGHEINLPRLSFELFIFFVQHAQHVCTIEQISKAVWQDTIVSNDTVVQRVTLLRKALADDAKAPKYIESVRGRGYRLIEKPQQVESASALRFSNKHRDKLIALSLVAAVVAVVAIASLFYWLNQDKPGIQQANSKKENVELSEVSSLIERGKYYYDVGQGQNLALANDLFERALSLQANNIDALVGLSLSLSKSVCRYNQDIEHAIKAKDLAQHAIQLDNKNSASFAALGYAWDCIGNLELALANYSRASDLDPENFSSKGSAAHLFAIKGDLLNSYKFSAQVTVQKSDSHLAQLQITAVLALLNFDKQAISRYEKLFSLYPDNVFINDSYPSYLYYNGQIEAAKTLYEQVLAREIVRSSVYANYAEVLWLMGNKDNALAYFKKAADLEGENTFSDTIVKLLEEGMDKQQAQLRIQTLEAIVEQGNTWPINFIEAATIALWVLNDHEQSAMFLEKAIELGYFHSEYLAISPLFAKLRNPQSEHSETLNQLIIRINERRESLRKDFLDESLMQLLQDIY